MSQNLDLSYPSCILLCGKPRAGKSSCIKFLLCKHSLDRFKGCAKFEFGLVFTRTKFNTFYSQFLPEEYVIEGYDEDILMKYLQGLEDEISKGNKVPPNYIVLDDLIALLQKNNPFFTNFLATHRHYNTTIFLATQHLKTGANTTLRECCSHAIIFNSKTFNTTQSLFENFGGLFKNVADFRRCLQETTKEPYTAMLYISDEDNIDKNYLKLKCPDTTNWDYRLDY